MKFRLIQIGIFCLTLIIEQVRAATLYVDLSSPSPTPPYTNWLTAATNIQDAVDVSTNGDTVQVAGGVYSTGGRAVIGTMTNRVTVDRAITVEGIMGPEVTIIQGYQLPGTTNGNGAIRGVYLTNGAVLKGFCVTGGATRSAGTFEWERSGGGVWCISTSAVVSDCVLVGNSAAYAGGGAYYGTLNNCAVISNSASLGGGAGNSALNNCMVSNNAASGGGGVANSTLNNCMLLKNKGGTGGGAYGSILNSCSVFLNTATSGGGTYTGTLRNCTVLGNNALTDGGGAYNATLNNCIVYYNSAPSGPNYFLGALNNCCTAPLYFGGSGNFTTEPELASFSHLSVASPCLGAGSAAYSVGSDIDGEVWANPPSVGCDEFHPGAVTGPLSARIEADHTNVATGFEVNFTAQIAGRVNESRWDFGDGTVVSNRPLASHSWTNPGDYSVGLWAYSETYSNGMITTLTVHVVEQPVHYVVKANASPVPPYTSWVTAATSIQNAIDAIQVPGALVLVTNGVFNSGGRVVDGSMTNRVAVTKKVIVRSVNGPAFTMIQGRKLPFTNVGNAAVRCVYLAAGATLDGFTLTNGATRNLGNPDREQSGGAVFCESINAVITNCVLTGNSAAFNGGGACYGTLNSSTLRGNSTIGSSSVGTSVDAGGGTYYAVLNACILSGNTASEGGGAYSGTLSHCTLTGNSVSPYTGGGVAYSTLYNCVLSNNSASSQGGGASYSTVNNCLLTGNSAYGGGGAAYSTLYGSTVRNNSAWNNYGGGAFQSTLNNCLVIGNSAPVRGGGAYQGTLNNCTLSGNWSDTGGGAASATLSSCIVYYNNSNHPNDANWFAGLLNDCCTFPERPGNITNAPLFIDLDGGNLRLQSNSPCINAGNNLYAPTGPDLEGSPRISGGTVDIGAYEFQSPSSVLSYAWAQRYGLPTDGSADSGDNDGDGMDNFAEWRSDTIPTNALSVLKIVNVTNSPSGAMISWQSVINRSYWLERATDLGAAPPFETIATNIAGVTGTKTFTDTSATNGSPLFYRVGVQ